MMLVLSVNLRQHAAGNCSCLSRFVSYSTVWHSDCIYIIYAMSSVCHVLFALPLGVIGRLSFVVRARPAHLLYYILVQNLVHYSEVKLCAHSHISYCVQKYISENTLEVPQLQSAASRATNRKG